VPNIHPGNNDAKVEVMDLMGDEVFLHLLTAGIRMWRLSIRAARRV
jgi:hypothetical protein